MTIELAITENLPENQFSEKESPVECHYVLIDKDGTTVLGGGYSQDSTIPPLDHFPFASAILTCTKEQRENHTLYKHVDGSLVQRTDNERIEEFRQSKLASLTSSYEEDRAKPVVFKLYNWSLDDAGIHKVISLVYAADMSGLSTIELHDTNNTCVELSLDDAKELVKLLVKTSQAMAKRYNAAISSVKNATTSAEVRNISY